MPVAEHIELINLLNRYRLAGYESYVPAPRYVSLDLYLTVCAKRGGVSRRRRGGDPHRAERRKVTRRDDGLLLSRPLHLRHSA